MQLQRPFSRDTRLSAKKLVPTSPHPEQMGENSSQFRVISLEGSFQDNVAMFQVGMGKTKDTPSPRVTRILVPEKHRVMRKPCQLKHLLCIQYIYCISTLRFTIRPTIRFTIRFTIRSTLRFTIRFTIKFNNKGYNKVQQ